MDPLYLKCGATVYPSKIIAHPQGNVLHGLKSSDQGFTGFGEAYFSTVLPGEIKGWKKHQRMFMNLLVPVGAIRFHLMLDSDTSAEHVVLGEANYQRLFVPPGIWLAFEGGATSTSLLMNVASIEHDPAESVTRDFVR